MATLGVGEIITLKSCHNHHATRMNILIIAHHDHLLREPPAEANDDDDDDEKVALDDELRALNLMALSELLC